MLATGANDGVFSFGLWEAEDSAAFGAFFISMRFSIAELVAAQAEEAAEFLVFPPTCLDLTRQHAREDPDYERDREDHVNERKDGVCYEQRHDGIDDHERDIHTEKRLIQRVGTVSAVEKANHGLLEFSHNGIFLPAARARQAAFLFGKKLIRSGEPRQDPSWRPDLRE